MRKITFICLFLSSLVCHSQTQFSIRGYLKDAKNGEAIIGAIISEKGTTTGATTNEYGFYSLTLSSGTHTLNVQYIGYISRTLEIDLKSDQTIDIDLSEDSKQLDEVVVTSVREDQNIKQNEMSTVTMDIKTIRKMPALLGEVDVIKSIQSLPGVTSVGEGTSGFNVRGGNMDQNLILLDDAPVFNSSHLLGFFSIFNPDAVKDVKLYKGAIPAQYGGRTSSVLDIRMKEGNNKRMEVNGGIGSIFSRLSFETPIIKNKASLIIAGRRSYIDALIKPFAGNKIPKGTQFYFYDLTAKINWIVNDKNTVFASGYFGRDILKALGLKFGYGNSTGTARWNHVYNNRWFSNITLYYSNYNYNLGFNDPQFSFDWKSNVINYSAKLDYSFFPNARHTLKFGAQGIYYTFKPGDAKVNDLYGNTPANGVLLPNKYAFQYSFYINNEHKISSRLSIQYGLRWSLYNFLGKGTAYTYKDSLNDVSKVLLKETSYKAGQTIKFYNVPEPRIMVNYVINDRSSVKASYARSAQYLQLVSNTAASSPLDIYTPATNNIRPLISDQGALGYFRNFRHNMFEASAEVYFKYSQNELDYIDNSNILLNKYLEADLLQGIGRAYGFEFYAKKNTGKLTGWISYTLSRTERKVNGISDNHWFLNRYDRPHIVNFVIMYEIARRLTVSSNFIYASGTPSTVFDSKIKVQGYYLPYNSANQRNNFRISPYHRLDLGLTYDFRKNDHRRYKQSITVSIYNVYNRRNAFAVYFQNNSKSGDPLQNNAIRLSIIGSIVPSITYNFKF